MDKKELIKIFKETGVLEEGHFKLTSGLHTDQYLQCAQVLQYPSYAQKMAEDLAEKFKDMEIDVVIGPAMGGVTLAYAVGLILGKKTIFTERKEGEMTLRRGFKLNEKDKVLVIDDVLTTGKSVREVIEVIKEEEAELVGVGVLIDRSEEEVDFGVPLEYLLEVEAKTYRPENCPICQKGKEITNPGSRDLNVS